MTGKYTGAALETMEIIMGGMNPCKPNKTYYNDKYNIYWYVNTKGYLHVLQPCIMEYGGRTHFVIRDSMLTKDDMLKETSVYGDYTTKEDCIDAIMEREGVIQWD